LQTTTADNGAFVFEEVTATGDLAIVVDDVPAGYKQKAEDGLVRNYAGTSVDYLTIRLVPIADTESVAAAAAAAELTWIVVAIVVVVLAIIATIVIILIRRKPAATPPEA